MEVCVRDEMTDGKSDFPELMIWSEEIGNTLQLARAAARKVPEEGLVGLGLSRAGNLGVRVEPTALAPAREVLCANDPRYTAENRSVVGKMHFEVQGLPLAWGTKASAPLVVKFLHELKWTVVPRRSQKTGGDKTSLTWIVAAVISPPDEIKQKPVAGGGELIIQLQEEDPAKAK